MSISLSKGVKTMSLEELLTQGLTAYNSNKTKVKDTQSAAKFLAGTLSVSAFISELRVLKYPDETIAEFAQDLIKGTIKP